MKKNDYKSITLQALAELVSKELAVDNIKAVLVGGACVSIYTYNKYQSLNLDYISPDMTKDIEQVMKRLGFERKGKFRHYENKSCPFYIEFPPGPVALGYELPVTKFNKVNNITLLTATDCVKDRLVAFYHWNDEQSLQQAVWVATSQEVDLVEIEKWSINERAEEKFKTFQVLLQSK
ncbi:MAG: hypothetical protein GF384_06635 [Elusimicrobia bacterium]|nr:hypothetical protein [Elusimicrobiota bacterium]